MPDFIDSNIWILIAAGGVVATLGYGIVLRFVLQVEMSGRHSRLPVPRSLSGRLLIGLLLLTLVPPIGLAISLGQRQLTQQRDQSQLLITSTAESVADDVDQYLEHAVTLVRAAAEGLGHAPAFDATTVGPLLLRYHQLEPDYLTMLVTSEQGSIVVATRTTPAGPVPAASTNRSVADRGYFREPMRTGRAYVSEVFRGRGLGSDPIVAISAPVERPGGRAGVAEASLDLRRFQQLERRHAFLEAGARLLILDQHDLVIYASPGTGLGFLDSLAGKPLAAADAGPQRVIEVSMASGAGAYADWLAARATTRQGWRVVVLVPVQSLAGQLSRDVGVMLGWLLVIVTCALSLALALQRQVTAPLELLQGQLRSFRIDGQGHEFSAGYAHTAEYGRAFRAMHRFGWRLRASYARLQRALADATVLRNELSAVLARREEEVRARTRDLDAANQELQRLARVDPLTGLANRRWFNEFLQQAWRVAQRERTPVTCMLLDVDYFKQYNDRYGHLDGDECLKRIADLVRESAGRALDHAARYGGEEFVVILSDAPLEAALKIAARLQQAVEALTLPHHGSPLGHVTVSIGVRNLVPGQGDSAEHALSEADLALYAAKCRGRNRIAVHDGNRAHVVGEELLATA